MIELLSFSQFSLLVKTTKSRKDEKVSLKRKHFIVEEVEKDQIEAFEIVVIELMAKATEKREN